MEKQIIEINGRTFADVKNDINEIAAFGYNQANARIWAGQQLSLMREKYRQKAFEENRKQKDVAVSKTEFVIE